MKILTLSDVHGDMRVYERIPELIRESGVRAVILAGDLLGASVYRNSIRESHEIQSEEIRNMLADIEVPLLYIMGNDDMIQWDYEEFPFTSIHAKGLSIENYRFLGYQHTPPFMGGIHEKEEQYMQLDFEQLQAEVLENDILVTHGPARGVLDTTSSGEHVGSPSLLNFIERNAFRCHIHGHIHESFGRDNKTFNVAAAHSRKATVIDLDNLNHEYLMLD